jgi:hypothetical protein
LAAKEAAHELTTATMFLAQSDRRRYGKLCEDLENAYTRGNDDYPKDVVQAFKMINEYKNWQPSSQPAEVTGTAFLGTERDTSWHDDATCHECGEKGHIRPNCPKFDNESKSSRDTPSKNDKKKDAKKKSKKDTRKKEDKEVTFTQNEDCSEDSESDSDGSGSDYSFCNKRLNASKSHPNLKRMILLDNQSTVDLFCNPSLVSNIRKTDKSMTVLGNGGTLTTNMRATVKNYGDVWFDQRAITNILSLKKVREKYAVTYDGTKGSVFSIHKEDGNTVEFAMRPDGLHYHDTNNSQLVLILTVKDNQEGYSRGQIAKAKHAGISSLRSVIRVPRT